MDLCKKSGNGWQKDEGKGENGKYLVWTHFPNLHIMIFVSALSVGLLIECC